MKGLYLRICIECSGVYGCGNHVVTFDCPSEIESCVNFEDCPIMDNDDEPLYMHGLCHDCFFEQIELLRRRQDEKNSKKNCRKTVPKSRTACQIQKEKGEKDSIKHSL